MRQQRFFKFTTVIIFIIFTPIANAQVSVKGMLDLNYGQAHSRSIPSDIAANQMALSIKLHNNNNAIQTGFISESGLSGSDYSSTVGRVFTTKTGKYGELQFGTNVSAAYMLQANDFVDYGHHIQWLKPTLSYHTALYLYSPGVWSNQTHMQSNYFNGTQYAGKLTYISPQIHNLIVGLSYIPNSNKFLRLANGAQSYGYKNIMQFATTYRNQINALSFKTSFSIENGRKTSINQPDLLSWDLGGQMAYMGFNVGGSYGKVHERSRGHYWLAGLSYSIANTTIGIVHFHSHQSNGDMCRYTLNITYHALKNLHLYGELSTYKLRSKPHLNQGENINALAVGFKVKF